MASETLLIIGGGPAGLEVARGAADLGYRSILVERRAHLGGTPISASYAALTHGMRDATEVMGEMITAVEHDPLVDIRLGTTVTACRGSVGDFGVTLRHDARDEAVAAG